MSCRTPGCCHGHEVMAVREMNRILRWVPWIPLVVEVEVAIAVAVEVEVDANVKVSGVDSYVGQSRLGK